MPSASAANQGGLAENEVVRCASIGSAAGIDEPLAKAGLGEAAKSHVLVAEGPVLPPAASQLAHLDEYHSKLGRLEIRQVEKRSSSW